MIPTLLSWSGGKDAAWALHALRQRGEFDVVGLLTTLTEGFDRISMQGIRRELLHAQAQAAGLPVIEAWIPQAADNAAYIASFSDAVGRAQARWPGLVHIAYGDLFLPDIRVWRETLCATLGITPLFPVFGSDTAHLARTMIAGGLRAQLCCVDTTNWTLHLQGVCSIPHSCATYPSTLTPAARTVSFTPVCLPGRCSITPSPSHAATACCAMDALPIPISN